MIHLIQIQFIWIHGKSVKSGDRNALEMHGRDDRRTEETKRASQLINGILKILKTGFHLKT